MNTEAGEHICQRTHNKQMAEWALDTIVVTLGSMLIR